MRTFILHNVKTALVPEKTCGYDETALAMAASKLKKLRSFSSFGKPSLRLYKRSVDARDSGKSGIFFVCSVAFSYPEDSRANTLPEDKILALCRKENVALCTDEKLDIPAYRGVMRPVICGFGPCGMFLALVLARAGARPIVLERGLDADERVKLVEKYWQTGELSEHTNVQFGEGGAGTFSDGKLLTRINDPLCSFVLETFASHGADPGILFMAKPHVGTDRLREIVKSIRHEIIALGGEVRFGSPLTSVRFSADGRLCTVGIDGEKDSLCTDALFLAVGHSARDTFGELYRSGFAMTAKPFSVGVRIEHLQKNIDASLYGELAGHPALPKGEYALSARFDERAVYSFCMCPGGTVVASASEKDSIVTNGMSYSARDGFNANAAIAVSVAASDFGNDPFRAMEYQASIERRAFLAAGSTGAAPIQTVGSFLGTGRNEVSDVLPTYTGKTALCEIDGVFPDYIGKTLRAGLRNFEGKIKGFSSPSAILTAPETRTSSPIRLPREKDYRACGLPCVFTCGEGAGYAGGITSAAVDGIRAALSFLRGE